MGIRYNRDEKRATNGPMFFFSILRDETFIEEIRSAFISGLSFYAYRFPHDTMMCYGSSESFIEGLGEPGFVIGMFSPTKPIITIPYHSAGKGNVAPGSLYQFPDKSTSYEEYSREVEEIVKAIKERKGSKVVASRVIIEEVGIDIAEKFYELSERFSEAFVFCFGTPATGCWIGASPELLLEGKNGMISSMALAGTRPSGSQEAWDEKNIEEQRIVTKYIVDIFQKNGLQPEIGDTYNKEAGTIEHICTGIKGIRDQGLGIRDGVWLEKLLKELSPTPALCGYPKEFALNEIERYENFDRGCYGGFCGPFHSLDDFSFNVVIRCASVSQKRVCKYAGGGITSQSSVDSEWEETNLKLAILE